MSETQRCPSLIPSEAIARVIMPQFKGTYLYRHCCNDLVFLVAELTGDGGSASTEPKPTTASTPEPTTSGKGTLKFGIKQVDVKGQVSTVKG